MALKKGARIGPFLIIDSLAAGKGGMAEVYHAQLEGAGPEVALKVSRGDGSDPRYNNALKQEVELLRPLSHPGVVRVWPLPLGLKQDPYMARALELPGNPWFYAMEWLPGGALSQYCGKGQPLPFGVACGLALRALDTLIYLHQAGVAHLDIKPDNLLLRYAPQKGASMEPVLIDFGVAAHTKTLTAHGGTVWTMPPEQIRHLRGESPPEASPSLEKMDIYSLGVVAYRMWTGEYPFDGLTSGSVTNSVLNSVLRPPGKLRPGIPPQADEMIACWLDKDPARRPELREMRPYLAHWSEGNLVFAESLRPLKGGWKLFG